MSMSRLTQLKDARGRAVYLDATAVEYVSAVYEPDKSVGAEVPFRYVYLAGGATVALADGPELLAAIGI
jgi:hypothetical protein